MTQRLVKVRVGDTLPGTYSHLLSIVKEPNLGGLGWIEYAYIVVNGSEEEKKKDAS